jgi:hypothetical protein
MVILPNQIGNLVKLEIVTLSSNKLTKLESISLDTNKFDELPTKVYEFINLKEYNYSDNKSYKSKESLSS